MSSFKAAARHKKTGELHAVWCIDDYFGRHKYGYIPNIEGGEAMTESQFNAQYKFEEHSNG